ncbi:SDR family NAD(P)-dependent oxidoreductase [Streptomyces sp. NPDC056323]|uniref:SDR family NAD(P)-dependent oxidoreductase n=1 Tax=Streptomyces sp. NPDC056323 TaxID=3345784 RepID=UPI0035D7CC43
MHHEKVASGIEGADGQVLVVRLDLEDLGTVEEAADTVIEKWGGIDVLVANAVRWGGDGPPRTRASGSRTCRWRSGRP